MAKAMSRLCLYQLKRCGGWANGPCECPHVETDDTESCKNHEVPAEIEILREENRKLRDALIEIYSTMAFLDGGAEFIKKYKDMYRGSIFKFEYQEQAESELRAEGVIR